MQLWTQLPLERMRMWFSASRFRFVSKWNSSSVAVDTRWKKRQWIITITQEPNKKSRIDEAWWTSTTIGYLLKSILSWFSGCSMPSGLLLFPWPIRRQPHATLLTQLFPVSTPRPTEGDHLLRGQQKPEVSEVFQNNELCIIIYTNLLLIYSDKRWWEFHPPCQSCDS